MSAKNTSKWGSDKARCYADGGEVGVGEKIARYLNGGRDFGQRAFYNQTRAGLWNPNAPPDEASPMGGLGQSLKTRRLSNMIDAVKISKEVPRRKD